MHASPLTAVDHHHANHFTATAAYDGQVQMWSDQWQAMWSFQAADLVNNVAFSRDGRRLAAGSADGFVYIFDSQAGTLLAQLGPHRDDVNAVAWHPDGETLCCVMDAKDARVAVWNTRTGEELAPIIGHEHGIFALAFNPAGDELVTAAEDGTCRIWRFSDRSQRAVLRHPGDPETVDWSPLGDAIASGCDDGVLRVWDARTGELAKTSNAATAAVRLVKFSADGKHLMAGSYEGMLRIHSFPDLAVARELQAYFQWERCATFGAQGSVIIGSFGDGPVVHEADGKGVRIPGPTFGINSMSAAQGMVCVGRDDGMVMNILDGTAFHQHPSIVNTVVIGPGGVLASGDYRGNLRLFNTQSHQLMAQVQLFSGPINTVAFKPDGSGLFSAGYDGMIREWTMDLTMVREWVAHHGPVKSLAYNSHADMLIAGSSDDTLSGWRQGEKCFHIDLPEVVLVNGVAASPTAPQFASASRDCRVRIWHAATGELLETLPPMHIKSVKAIAYSDDGQRILTGAYDGLGMLWSRHTAQDKQQWQAHRLQVHGKPGVPAVAFDGNAALTAGWDGTVGRWNAQGELITQYQVKRLHTQRLA